VKGSPGFQYSPGLGGCVSPAQAQGMIPASEVVYELLTLGTSAEQVIGQDRRSFSLKYIDWAHPEQNVYQVTDEFTVERRGSYNTYRPDIVLFVNGIPLVVIECTVRLSRTRLNIAV